MVAIPGGGAGQEGGYIARCFVPQEATAGPQAALTHPEYITPLHLLCLPPLQFLYR